MRLVTASSLALLLGLLCTSPTLAQQGSNTNGDRILDATALNAALVDHEPAVDQQRAELAELLSTPQLRDLAGERGIDLERVESVAAGLSDAEVEGLAPLVTKVTAALQRGTVTISVTAIIIILLILILVS